MSSSNELPVSQAITSDDIDFLSRSQTRLPTLTCSLLFVGADLAAATLAQAFVIETQMVWTPSGAPTPPNDMDYPFIVLIILGALISWLALRGRYTRRTPFEAQASELFLASGWTIAAQSLAAVLSHDLSSRIPGIIVVALFPLMATLANSLAKRLLLQIGAWQLPIVLIGEGDAASAAEAALASDPTLGYSVVGRVDPQCTLTLSNSSFLRAILKRHQAAQLLFAIGSDTVLQRQLIDAALRDNLPFAMTTSPKAMPALAWQTTRFLSHDVVMLSFPHGTSRRLAQAAKTAIDVFAALVLLILSCPIFLVAAVINLFSDGPLFFAHPRLGIDGRIFPCLKFRTMVINSDHVINEAFDRNPDLTSEWAATDKLRDDPRVTPIGRLLRKSGLDELPQLINVIRRQMSLVGPRPIVESEVHFYGDDIARYFNTRPGMTGLWQVSGRSNISYAQRIQLDIWYVNNWSIWLDITVLLKALTAALRRRAPIDRPQ